MDLDDFPVHNNVIVNVSEFGVNMTADRLKKMFEKYGAISSYGVLNNDQGWLRFGYVAFKDLDAAKEAVIEMNGQMIDDFRRISVRIRKPPQSFKSKQTEITNSSYAAASACVAATKLRDPYLGRIHLTSLLDMRERRLNLGAHSASTATLDSFSDNVAVGHSVFVKNLYPQITKDELRRVFLPYGRVLSTRVIRNPNNAPQSSVYGFVTFFHKEHAERAIREKSGHLIGTRIVTLEMARGKRHPPLWSRP